ncbi:MAG: histidine kinase [Weeksellaceae bacterium]|jgi:signal transduction histidine kinase|nr:histidine kinase [Weeksellaceae bacterium]
MSLKFALIISVILQVAAAVIAITLIKKNKSNVAWWLISLGFLFMAIRRIYELLLMYYPQKELPSEKINGWLAIVISFVMLISLSFVKRIFNIQKKLENLKEKNEAILFSSIIRAEENIKQEFSKELHDGLGPLLSSVKMSLSAVSKDSDPEKNEKILNNAQMLIDESIRTIKEISNNLSPHVLNNFGLHRALKSFINKLPVETGPKFSFKSNIYDLRFSYTIETVIYRIICELITNTLKHADASNIFLDLVHENETLNIKYMDDGKGFEWTENTEIKSGLGIINIKSRIKSVNGTCQIFTKPNEGFNILIRIKTS